MQLLVGSSIKCFEKQRIPHLLKKFMAFFPQQSMEVVVKLVQFHAGLCPVPLVKL